jgi:hypothetical protein
VLEALGRLGREAEREQLVSVLRRVAPSWLVQLPALVKEVVSFNPEVRTATHVLRGAVIDEAARKAAVVELEGR